MVAVTRISSTLFIRFLYYNVQSLLGVIFDLVGIIFFLTDCSNFLLLFTQGYGEVSLSKQCEALSRVSVGTNCRAC